MRICLIGKYPPIEGGVSACTYWLARGLAQRGHDVHVVTNAAEVEERYRLLLGPDDADWRQPRFGGARVRVYDAEPFTRSAMGHIPIANPFVSKLASLATDVIRRNDCNVVLAYYYEPYAVAGWLASSWTGCPLVVKHAGSDLDRLFRVPDMATTYKEVLRSTHAVVTQPRLIARFLGMGVDRGRIEFDPPYFLPPEAFAPTGETLDISRAAVRTVDQGRADTAGPGNEPPTIGIYGKIGVTKGTFDLIASLGRIARDGIDFRLAAMIGETQGRDLLPALREARIEDRTVIVPMLPNWRVSAFLRTCTAVAFLERDFPVAIHGPIVPREVLACGTCLILSREIAAKQRYRERLADGENVVIVEDPRNHGELTAKLRAILADSVRTQAIGASGLLVSRFIERPDIYVPDWEALLTRHARSDAAVQAPARAEGEAFEWIIPDLAAYLRQEAPERLFSDFASQRASSAPVQSAIEFCGFAAGRLTEKTFGASLSMIQAILFYARERLIASCDPPGASAAVFPVVDRLGGAVVSETSAGDLRPVMGASARVVAFGYDVSAHPLLASVGGHEAVGDGAADLTGIEPSPMLVLFHRSANLIPCELRIDEPTGALIARCDGALSTRRLIEEMCPEFGATTAEQRSQLAERIYAALGQLYRAGVLVFGDYREGWGWDGGDRA